MKSLANSLSVVVAFLLSVNESLAQTYGLVDSYTATDFYNEFTWQTIDDPTGGVGYVAFQTTPIPFTYLFDRILFVQELCRSWHHAKQEPDVYNL